MKLRIVVATLLLLVMGASPVAAQSPEVQWRADLSLDEALALAQAQGTLVMVDVYATWCGPCHMLDQQVFNQTQVTAVTDTMIALKIDAETSPGEVLVERYHVVGYPTVLFLAPDGREIDRIFGFLEAEAFARTAQGYQEGQGTLEALEGQLSAEPDNLELRYDVFFRNVVRGRETRALRLAESIHHRDPRNASGLHPKLHYDLGKYLYARGAKDYALAITYFEELQRRWPASDEATASYYAMARAYLGRGEEDSAFAVLDAYIAANPDDSGVYNTVAWFCFQNEVRLEHGIAVAKRGLESNPSDAGLWDTLAELQFAVGDPAGAVASIDKAIAAAPDDPYFVEQRARFSAARAP